MDPEQEIIAELRRAFTPAHEGEHSLDPSYGSTAYKRPSHASLRPVAEPPIMDFRKYEEGGSMYHALHRHPDTPLSPEKWFEITDAEIQTEVLSDYRRWIHDMALEARSNGNMERARFYETLFWEVDGDGYEGQRVKEEFKHATINSVPRDKVGIDPSNPNVFHDQGYQWNEKKRVYEGVPVIMRRVPGTDEFASVALRPDLFEPLERYHGEAKEADAYNGDGLWEPSISERKDARAAEREKSRSRVEQRGIIDRTRRRRVSMQQRRIGDSVSSSPETCKA